MVATMGCYIDRMVYRQFLMRVSVVLSLIVLSLPAFAERQSFTDALVEAAIERTRHRVRYDGRYIGIDYPGGDVPADIGVCTDVVIRSYRALNIDLQELVHLDMKQSFDAYPKLWGLTLPDTNIDHRRVPNLQTFFSRHGEVLGASERAEDYDAGDLVTWMLPGNLPHIGIVVDRMSSDGKRPLIVHNIGHGPKLEDVLFRFPITGHYRYTRHNSAERQD